MLLSKTIENLQAILTAHGDYPVGIRADYDHDLLMAYLWDEDQIITMRLDGRPHVSYEVSK